MNVNNVMSEYKDHNHGEATDPRGTGSVEQVPFDSSPHKENEILDESDEEMEEVDQFELNKQLD